MGYVSALLESLALVLVVTLCCGINTIKTRTFLIHKVD